MHSVLVQTGSYMEITCHLKKIEVETETRTSRFIFVCHECQRILSFAFKT